MDAPVHMGKATILNPSAIGNMHRPEPGLFACAAEPRCGTIGDEADNRSFVLFTRRCDRRRHLSRSNTYLYTGRNRPQEHLPLGAVNVSVGSNCEILPCRSKKQRLMRSANAPRRRQDRCDIAEVVGTQILSDRSGSSLWRLSPSLTRWRWRFSLLPAFAPGARVRSDQRGFVSEQAHRRIWILSRSVSCEPS
jgi:hypothetical protein